MNRTLENRFYYLDNFHTVVTWVRDRHAALLDGEEQAFIERFLALEQPSRALLVRMVMRKGELFRSGKLRYEEIGDTRLAAAPLVRAGWVDERPPLTLDELFCLLTRAEIDGLFRDALPGRAARKAEQLEALRAVYPGARCFDAWHPASGECVYRLQLSALCDRLRLLFFGNLHQDWSEFVLSDLGITRYEKVEFSVSSQAFHNRADVDAYLHLWRCRERLDAGEDADAVLADLPPAPYENDWLEQRRRKFLFQAAQQHERAQQWEKALALYAGLRHPGARIRQIRMLERIGDDAAAFALARSASAAPESEAESQQLLRMLPRLQRRLGHPKTPARQPAPAERIDLCLPQPRSAYCVEELVRAHLARADAPACYVENTLINSLFGLLCWDAVFAAVPGAFFHPFHSGPADLHAADFAARRKTQFDACFAALESPLYKDIIRQRFRDKAGIQSPFVFWDVLDAPLLELALDCIPAAHLRKWFERMLQDIRANRAGFPDLIQFYPREKRYRMIEVKAPGDRLQDNQVRWLEYCAAHGMPVAVCRVQWLEDGA
ncbi:MAG TPA: VRR-NUC domain-containing protein [Noviherbaspirillum sp.]|uniref:VRR-NUC domain-containing protein n=1 Tax=Noviherbaspirillum sp. TaxID=1926288 RepID=UPI002D61CD53|nr:VRR-NUC domain-containing protein [Noviherbaspirillum sp.]HYD96275.1 VRR-NUC domain-containing protein [Noviherbaspirillum sp.]